MEQFDARSTETTPVESTSLADAVSAVVAEEHAAAAAANPATAADPPWDTSKPRVIEPVEIILGGEVRHMRLPMWALNRFKKATGASPWDHDRVWGFPPDPEIITALIWAALLEEDPTILPGQVERFPEMDLTNMLYIRARLDLLWGRTNPEPSAAQAAGGADPNQPTAILTG